jgi:hypothetical protein
MSAFPLIFEENICSLALADVIKHIPFSSLRKTNMTDEKDFLVCCLGLGPGHFLLKFHVDKALPKAFLFFPIADNGSQSLQSGQICKLF